MEKTSIKTYQDLIVWKKAVELVKEIYRLTKKLPPDEKFGLISQITRSSMSIPANIAVGDGNRKVITLIFLKYHGDRFMN